MGKCYNSTVVNASIEKVWEAMNDFHDLSWGAPVVTKCDKVADIAGTEIGAKRVINDAFHETLLSVDVDNHSFSYSIDDGPGPVAKGAVSNYVGVVSLSPVTDVDQTFVQWVSTYESPSDEAVGELCNPVYAAVLGALKANFSS